MKSDPPVLGRNDPPMKRGFRKPQRQRAVSGCHGVPTDVTLRTLCQIPCGAPSAFATSSASLARRSGQGRRRRHVVAVAQRRALMRPSTELAMASVRRTHETGPTPSRCCPGPTGGSSWLGYAIAKPARGKGAGVGHFSRAHLGHFSRALRAWS